jgi:hypothetical protein
VALSPQEKMLMKRLTRVRALFGFFRLHRHELFDEAEKLEARAAHREEQRRRDVPLVEDFPLHAEEETPEFRDLKFTLELRVVRALEHWKGKTQVTLADLIYGLVERMQTSTP